jgi:hypothetical protein
MIPRYDLFSGGGEEQHRNGDGESDLGRES